MSVKHQIRTKDDKTRIATLTARRAIIEFCKECMNFDPAEVRRCTDKLCPLFPFRTFDTPKNTV